MGSGGGRWRLHGLPVFHGTIASLVGVGALLGVLTWVAARGGWI